MQYIKETGKETFVNFQLDKIFSNVRIMLAHPFLTNAPMLYPLKKAENHRYFNPLIKPIYSKVSFSLQQNQFVIP